MSLRRLPIALLAMVALAGNVTALAAAAEGVSSAQKRAATEYLAAVSSAGAEGLAGVAAAGELDSLRTRLMRLLKDEALRGGQSLRTRLFGSATTLATLERMTSQSFFLTLARRINLTARAVIDPDWLTATRIANDRVIVLVRDRISADDASASVVQLVELVADGKDWKPALPGELLAQVEELQRGRQQRAEPAAPRSAPATTSGTAPAAAGETPAATTGNTAAMLALLTGAEKALVDGRCDRYYKEFMSPGFRRTQSDKAMATLIASCQRSLGTRELLISSLRIVRRLQPVFEADGTRAWYDVTDQGLPYERFTLEEIDKRWYIAE